MGSTNREGRLCFRSAPPPGVLASFEKETSPAMEALGDLEVRVPNEVSGQWPPSGAAPFEKETSAGVAVASKPPYSLPRAFGSKNGGLEATATVFRKLLG